MTIFPINHDNNHWSLAAMAPQDDIVTLFHFDSMASPERSKHVLSKLKRCMCRHSFLLIWFLPDIAVRSAAVIRLDWALQTWPMSGPTRKPRPGRQDHKSPVRRLRPCRPTPSHGVCHAWPGLAETL